MAAHVYEITFIDSGKTVHWTEAQCRRHFGRYEWIEIREGYAPHIVAVRRPGGAS